MLRSDVEFCDTVKNWHTFVPAEKSVHHNLKK